jgi:hypothetical protein
MNISPRRTYSNLRQAAPNKIEFGVNLMRVVLHGARDACTITGQFDGQLDVEVFERVQAVLALHGFDAGEGNVLGFGSGSSGGFGAGENREQLDQHCREMRAASKVSLSHFWPQARSASGAAGR